MPGAPRYTAPALEGALSILETLGTVPQMGVSELAKKLGLSKGSVYRLLATLVRRGYVEKDASSDRYQLTIGCLPSEVVPPSGSGCARWPSRSWSGWEPRRARP